MRQVRDWYVPDLQAIRKGDTLPRESPVVRFNAFLEDVYLRIGGRLQFADLCTPFSFMGGTIYGPVNHANAQTATSLGDRIVLSELREEFWILRARQAYNVLHTCLPCKIARNPFGQEREAPMPADSHCFQALSDSRYTLCWTPLR